MLSKPSRSCSLTVTGTVIAVPSLAKLRGYDRHASRGMERGHTPNVE